jgi:2-C-methyl-D-erythritol 4-phosphate cytidylyltransferase
MPPESKKTCAIVVAAGRSARLKGPPGAPRKPFLVIEGRTVLEHACAAFDAVAAVTEIVLVGNEEDVARLRQMASSSMVLRKVSAVVAGGELRADSVRAGVAAAKPSTALVAIHDAARPLVTPATIERAIALAAEGGAAVVAVPVVDTIKTSSDGVHAQSTLDRSVLWSAQTPQVFRASTFRELLARAAAERFRPTDDAALFERYLGGVPICEGDPTNFKLTTASDVLLATAVLRARREDERRSS